MEQAEAISFSSALSGFASKILGRLFIHNPGKNLICSPLSIHTCMGMLRQGAAAGTATEMDKNIAFTSKNEAEMAESFFEALIPLEDSSVLRLAYKMYLNPTYETRQEFQEVLAEKFCSELERIDFSENTSASEAINGWVETKTDRRISNLVNPEVLGDDTNLMLVSAAHFKAEWSIKFPLKATRREFFHMDEKNRVKVLMMNIQHIYDYASMKDLDVKVLRMSFSNSHLQMLIILPNKKTGLERLLEVMQSTPLTKFMAVLTPMRVILKLPKFSAEFDEELSPSFKEMGVLRVFTDKAELGNLLEVKAKIKVSKIIHKASIEFNENGTEVEPLPPLEPYMVNGRIRNPPPPVEFYADHPFYYAIYDATNGPLLVGSLQSPIPACCIDAPHRPCYCER